MNTGKYYNTLLYGSFHKKFIAKVKVLNSWLQNPKLKEISSLSGRPTFLEYLDFLSSIVVYGTTLEDYILFKFYNKNHKERKTYVTGRKIHRFFGQVNKQDKTKIFIDKCIFQRYFSEFMDREIFILDDKGNNVAEAKEWLQDKKVIFVKTCQGSQGKGVKRLEINDADEIIEFCVKNKYLIMEEEIKQHPVMAKLYPNAVNTIRFITLVDNNEVKILGLE